MSRRVEWEIRTRQTEKTERRSYKIMENWSRESGIRSAEEEKEAGCLALKQCLYDSCLRPIHSTDKCLWL